MTEFDDPSSPDGVNPNNAASASPSMAEIDREVAEAMADMASGDLAELTGGVAQGEVSAPGTEIVGTVTGVTNDDIFLQLGVKSQGVLLRSQFGKKEVVEVGRRVDVVVDRYDPESGLLIVNRKGAIQRATWTNLTVGMIVEGKVTGLIKGGLEVDLKGIRAFMPGSQCDVVPMKDISVLLNQTVRCEVMELDRRSKSVILSRRRVQEHELAESREKLRAELAEGQIRSGVVRSITDFGAFVDLGGVDGLIHIRELSWGSVAKVSDVVTLGQHVDVMVLKVDAKRERISLGLRQVLPDPWLNAAERYPVGTHLKVRVVRLADFGAFAELEPGVEGLIPISEMGWSRTRKSTDAVSVGSVVDCVVIRLEVDKKRIALSMKQVQADPWAEVLDSFPVSSLVKGKISHLADFGAFVEIAPGIEGLVHISELSDKRIKTCSEVVQPGQEVELRVLGVDRENRRISLSIKAVHMPTAAENAAAVAAVASAPAKVDKKRKKPLRGGLSSHFDW